MQNNPENFQDGQNNTNQHILEEIININQYDDRFTLFFQNPISQEQLFNDDALCDLSPQTCLSKYDQASTDRDNLTNNDPFNVVKTIAKIKKNRSKKFVKRPLLIEPISRIRFRQHNQFMLYCYLQIEDIYFDFNYLEDGQMKDLPTTCQLIEKIDRNLGEQGGVTVHVHSMVSSGIKDFQFLLNHFSRLQSPQYVQLYELLQLYQQKCIEQAQHLKELHLKLQTRIIYEDEITQAIEQFHIYLSQKIKDTFEETDFIGYTVTQLNPETEDVNMRSVTMSESLISLSGYDNYPSTMNGLPNLTNLSEMLGINRLNNNLGQLKLLLGFEEYIIIEQDILTADNIQLSVSIKFSYIDWPDRPPWMAAWDLFATTIQVFVGMNQLEALLKIRGERASQKRQATIGFEQQVQSEIFIEKFYPNVANAYQQNNSQIP